MSGNLDTSILQDFLTESGELLERLEEDLVVLERDPNDPEMLNQVFRALHTIKGSASFLSLTNLVSVAHAAEGALNAARNRVVTVDKPVMDLLLQAVDQLKKHMAQLQEGAELSAPSPDLVAGLTAIAEGKHSPAAGAKPAAAAPAAPAAPKGTRPLDLPPGKADLLEFLVADLEETLNKLVPQVKSLADASFVSAGLSDVIESTEALGRAVEFFGADELTNPVRSFSESLHAIADAKAAANEQAVGRLGAIIDFLRLQATELKSNRVLTVSTATLLDRTIRAASGDLPESERFGSGANPLEFDGVTAGAALPVAVPESRPVEPSAPASAPASASQPEPAADGDPTGSASKDSKDSKKAVNADQTIRVEVGRLESLMNLVGELVLQKNRIAALSRGFTGQESDSGNFREAITTAAGGLDRITGDLQVAVMRTRMQPLDKLFGRYPRLIRDLAAKTGKQIELVIEGGDTEVDKSVIEELNDPLVHVLRNSADHGIELPADRQAKGKNPTGTLTLSASHEGGHVRIVVRDDGRGLSRDKIAAKAVERGLVTAEAVVGMTDRQVFDFIFLPGFSTAEKVSDLSGRGVGMDVVRTNVRKLKGEIELTSEYGKGTAVAITIPLTVAILPAMLVSIASEIYAIPLASILEIVRPGEGQISTVGGRRVMRLRDSVLPLVEGSIAFGAPGAEQPFAVVLQQGDHRMGLMVTKPVGQQEIVVKPLGVAGDGKKPVSGATVRDDGGVSLIVDVAELMRAARGADQG